MSKTKLRQALEGGDNRAVIRAMRAANAARADRQIARCQRASLEALEEMFAPRGKAGK